MYHFEAPLNDAAAHALMNDGVMGTTGGATRTPDGIVIHLAAVSAAGVIHPAAVSAAGVILRLAGAAEGGIRGAVRPLVLTLLQIVRLQRLGASVNPRLGATPLSKRWCRKWRHWISATTSLFILVLTSRRRR